MNKNEGFEINEIKLNNDNINIKPNIEKTEIIGCKVTKKQVKRNKFIT